MILFKNELPLDHEKPMENLVDKWTQELVDYFTDTPFSNSWESCWETAWAEIEEQFNTENLQMIHFDAHGNRIGL